MSKSFIIEVGKRHTLRLPPELAADLREGAKLEARRGRNGDLRLTPVQVSTTAQMANEEAVAGIRQFMDELSQVAREKGITEETIQAKVKRMRARRHGATRRT